MPTEKEIKKLRPKVHMGGSVFRNGKNVDKEVERETARKYSKEKSLKKAEKGVKKETFMGNLAKHVKKHYPPTTMGE